jgi:pyruvate-formate lyase-activating enzyme
VNPAGTILHRTRSFCCECQTLHEADLRTDGSAVFFDVHCPTAAQSVRISSDAATFQSIRRKSALPAPPIQSARDFTWANFIEITKECNCKCAICFSVSGPGAAGQRTSDEVVRLAQGLKQRGLCAITLSGGEPTLHPQLVEIVSKIRALGMDVTVASNGLRIGQDPGLAHALRRSKLTYLYLQMDTLRADVCRKMRGDDFVAIKRRAVAHARKAGLRFGFTTTVVRDNLDEVGDVLRYAAAQTPHLGVVGYLSAAAAGRFLLAEDAMVNREDIIGSLIQSGAVDGLAREHFWPFPRFAPFALDVHPDCAALLFLAVTPGRLRPLDDFVDIQRLYQLMRRASGRFNRVWGFLLLSFYFALSIRPRRVVPLLRMVLGMLTKMGRHTMMVVSVEQFLGRVYQDQERLERCTTCNVRPDGCRVSTCIFEHPDPRRSPLARARAES